MKISKTRDRLARPGHRRNPRRAYDRDGRETPPATVASWRDRGATTVSVHCTACRRHAIVSTDGLPEDYPIPDIGLRLRCSGCGAREISVSLDATAFYARLRGAGHGVGGEVAVDEGRVVLRSFVRG